VNLILRVLGLNLLAHVGARITNPVARTLTSLILIGTNVLPIVGVLQGQLGLADVFVLYWLENVVVWLVTIIRLSTVHGGDRSQASFFAIHYGIFTLVHGVFAGVLAVVSGGFRGGILYWIVVPLAMLASHLISLGVNWFGREEYRVASAGRVMAFPYPRMLAMHGSVIAGFLFVLDSPSERSSVISVAILCGLKMALDLGFHVYEHVTNQRGARA
jgi:hypothetical protein